MVKCLGLVPACTNGAVNRGLCHRCYQRASRDVRTRKTSWKRLIDAGLALRKKKVSSSTSPFWSQPGVVYKTKRRTDEAPK
jgi:hypothetical protein